MIQFKKNLGMAPGMKLQQDSSDLIGYQAGDFRASGTDAAQRAPQLQPLARAMDPADLEAMRQANGEIFSPAQASAPPTRTIAMNTPAQAMESQMTMSSNRMAQGAQIDASNAQKFAEVVAAPQAAQRQLDTLRGMSAGYQQRDTTGDLAMAQQHAQDYVWSVMSPRQRGDVDYALARLAQGVA